MRGMVKGPIQHEVKPSALVSRPYPSPISRSAARTGTGLLCG